jgi:hypothetical protein
MVWAVIEALSTPAPAMSYMKSIWLQCRNDGALKLVCDAGNCGCAYGIHAMDEEHFGMAVAEMVRAGCIVFAPNSGGPVQIRGGDQRLLYDSVEDAAQKIQSTMGNTERQKDLRDWLATCGTLFSAERFVNEFR